MDGLIKCILLTDSTEIIFIINNLSNISVDKTLSKMCLQNKKIPIKKGNRRWFTNMQYFYKNNIIQNVFTKQNILTEIF